MASANDTEIMYCDSLCCHYNENTKENTDVFVVL